MTTFDAHADFGYALVTVAPAPALTGQTLTVGSAALYPAVPFNAVAFPPGVCAFDSNAEIVRVTNIVGNVLTVDRAQEGTTAKAIAVGWQLANVPTVSTFTDIENAINATEAVTAAILANAVFDGDAAGGVLSGTYPNPGFAVDMATQAELDAVSAASVILLPTTDARNVIQPSAATVVPLTLKGFAAQSDDLLQFQSSAALPLLAIDELGYITGGTQIGAGIAPLDLAPSAVVAVTAADWIGSTTYKLAEAVRARMTAAPLAGNDFLTQFVGADFAAQGPASAFDHGNVYGIRTIGEFRGTKALNGAAQTNSVRGLLAEAYDWDYTATGNDATGTLAELVGVMGIAQHAGQNRIGSLIGLRGQANALDLTGLIGVAPGTITGNLIGVSGAVSVDNSISSVLGLYGGSFVASLIGTTVVTTTSQGVYVGNWGHAAAGVSYGINVQAQSGGSLPHAIYAFGGDSRLHAGTATVVPLTLKGAAAQSGNLLDFRNSADALMAAFSELGVLEFGAAGDTNLYRSGADELKTDDSFNVALDLKVVGKTKIAAQADLTINGTTLDMTAGEILAFGDPVYVKSDGKVWKADANGTATFPAIGIAGGSAAANATVSVLVHGVARNDAGWNWTVGGIIYLSITAGLTQTQPSATNEVIQVLGLALTADVMYVSPDLFYITHV